MLKPLKYSFFTIGLVLCAIVFCCLLPVSSVRAETIILTPPYPMAIFHFSGSRPNDLGVTQGKLASCPSSPNCVSSQSTDSEHYIEPLASEANPKETFVNLKKTLDSLKEAEIVTADENYIYVEFTSKLMGFVDDVEFYLDEATGTIQVRSASRLGESDLGVNRKRIEMIREELKA
ncbi:MAG: DUF1499 domain-containing protein [Cyanobacteriota bacterium]|nr:DUF1499 domain-containing protein [Cyanobacteriota bacterium]